MSRGRQIPPRSRDRSNGFSITPESVAQVPRGGVGDLEEQPPRDPALGFEGHAVVVVRGAVVHVGDVRIARERPRLVDVEPAVRPPAR